MLLDTQTDKNIISESVLQRLAGADKTAIQECIDTYGDWVWSFAKMKTASAEEAERLTLKIFSELWKCAAQHDPAKCQERIFIQLLAHRANR